MLLVVLSGVGPATASTNPDLLTTEERAWLDAHGPIQVLLIDGTAPFGFLDNGYFRGITADLIALMTVESDLRFEIVPSGNLTTTLRTVRNGTGDVIPALIQTPDRTAYLSFAAPYAEVGTSFWVRGDAELPPGMEGQRVAVVANSANVLTLQTRFPNAAPLLVEDTRGGLLAVENGLADAFFNADPNTGYEARTNRFYDLVPSGPPLDPRGIGVAVRKDEPLLLSIMSKAVTHIRPEQRTAIFIKWTGLDLTPGAREPRPAAFVVPAWIQYGAGGLALLVILLLGSVLLLRRQVRNRTRALAIQSEREAKLAELTRALEQSNRDLEQFASLASHDLQEPLRMVSAYVSILSDRYQGKLDAEADEFIRYARNGAHRMQQLINDLLSYARVDTRGAPIEPAESEAALQRALENLSAAIAESQAAVTHDPLPRVRADATQLAQVFQNLVGNAVKFRSQEAPRVHVSARPDDGEWIFSVRDNGIGIDPKYFGRIFAIFQRLHRVDEYPGTGIGLALCKKIVERHGGRIWVESQPGNGSNFLFTLPPA